MFVNLKRLKAERVAKGMTQDEISKNLEWSKAKYTKLENGYSKLGADDLAKIANIIGIEDMNIFFNFDVDEMERERTKQLVS
ncbi:putative Cro-like protein, phage associated [Lactococcus hodotermopsidis]|uniref:Putative Cro-like protein, phage associated n=1 Tax=Pseudolactococcus hodotermopsidis TaxID=2709157 RepID=A0A6A0BFB9_9LACT|nr:helix-turn-helix transcriptional regulator [Lactococcus hodotermopsidis]GFH43395.1 putative Cro-like protein, phage associated [Lactococcus hodotermopsidis]